MIRHHPSDATLTAYAGGMLPEALGLVVAAHLYGCAACRETRAMAEAVGGAVIEALPPTAMTEDALALVLARAERPMPRVAPLSRGEGERCTGTFRQPNPTHLRRDLSGHRLSDPDPAGVAALWQFPLRRAGRTVGVHLA